MCYPVCGSVYIREPLLLIKKNSPCSVGRGLGTIDILNKETHCPPYVVVCLFVFVVCLCLFVCLFVLFLFKFVYCLCCFVCFLFVFVCVCGGGGICMCICVCMFSIVNK